MNLKIVAAYIVLALALIVMIVPPATWPQAAYFAAAVGILTLGYIILSHRRKKPETKA